MTARKGFSKRLRWIAVASGLWLAGCASQNCNILSTSHSFGCKAMYVALAVPALPVALASNAMDNHRDRKRQEETWRLLQANDPATVARCALGCYLPEKLGKEQDFAAFERSVELVIAWWGEHPEPAQMPVLMKAYAYKGAKLADTDPVQAEVFLRKAAALAADPRMTKALDSFEYSAYVYNQGYYDDVAENIQVSLIVLRYRGIPGRAPAPEVLKDRCQAIAAWPPAWMTSGADYHLELICGLAYSRVFDKWSPTGTPAVVKGVLDPVAAGADH